MPKMKSRRGARKRFKITKNGKVLKASSGKSHMLEKKSPKRKRDLRGVKTVNESEAKKIKKMMPYV